MPPVNDNLASARVITADATFNDTTVGATNESGSELSGYDDVGVWYRLEFPSTGKWRMRVSNVTPLYNAPNNTYSSFGGRIYGVASDPPGDIDDLTFIFEDVPRSEFVNREGRGYISTEDVAQTAEHSPGDVLYVRMGAAQSSGFPYYLWTGTFTIEFEFITPPYNPGSAPPNSDMSTATLMDVS